MSQPGLPLRSPPPFAATEIRRSLTERMRIPTVGYAIVRHEGGCDQARVVNLSRGGVFLGARNLLPVGAQPALYLAGIDGNFEDEVFESKGRGHLVHQAGHSRSSASARDGRSLRRCDRRDQRAARFTHGRIDRDTTLRPLVNVEGLELSLTLWTAESSR